MANADTFEMQLIGRGGHAAQPHMTIDPIPCGAAIVQALQTIVGRRVSPVDAAVVSVTLFQAGSAHNVIPDNVTIAGTARSFKAETRQLLEDSIREISETAAHVSCGIEFWHGGYPAAVNHAAEAGRHAADVMLLSLAMTGSTAMWNLPAGERISPICFRKSRGLYLARRGLPRQTACCMGPG